MIDEQEWREAAERNNGSLLIWIAQGDDPGLQQANSRGVCFALTKAWVTAFTGYRIDRTAFVNSFQANAQGGRIPAVYLAQQADYSRVNRANNLRFEAAFDDLKARIQRGEKVDAVGLRDAMLAARQSYFGRSCIGFERYREEVLGTAAVFNAPATPAYFMYTMHAPGKLSHVVGFELRPDVQWQGRAGLFEFFDANLGLFAFPTAKDLETFWMDVHLMFYGGIDMRVGLATFGIGRGGYAKTWTELLVELKDWIAAWWNSLWGNAAPHQLVAP